MNYFDGNGLIANGNVGDIGGTVVFALFPPARTLAEVLTAYGLELRQRQILDAEKGLAAVSWLRSSWQKKSA